MFHRKEISIMFQQIFLAVIGFCAGVIIAGGVVGLLIGLSIVPRYAGVTHTGKHILLYEDITLLGIVFGNLFFLYRWPIPGGMVFLGLCGLFSGIFLGGWIMHWPKWQMSSPSFPEGSRLTKRDPPGGDRRSLGKSTRLFVLLLSKMVSVNFPITNRREHSCPLQLRRTSSALFLLPDPDLLPLPGILR